MSSKRYILDRVPDEAIEKEMERRKEVKRSRPKPLLSINLLPIISACEEHLDSWNLPQGNIDFSEKELIEKILREVYGSDIFTWGQSI